MNEIGSWFLLLCFCDTINFVQYSDLKEYITTLLIVSKSYHLAITMCVLKSFSYILILFVGFVG
jgi:hypothetical protein